MIKSIIVGDETGGVSMMVGIKLSRQEGPCRQKKEEKIYTKFLQ